MSAKIGESKKRYQLKKILLIRQMMYTQTSTEVIKHNAEICETEMNYENHSAMTFTQWWLNLLLLFLKNRLFFKKPLNASKVKLGKMKWI